MSSLDNKTIKKTNENQKDGNSKRPIYILKRKNKGYFSLLFGISNILLIIGLIFGTDKIYLHIIFICLLFIIYMWTLVPSSFRSLACYDEYIEIDYSLWRKVKVQYSEIIEFDIFGVGMWLPDNLEITKKIYSTSFFRSVITIPMLFFNNDEFIEFKNILISKRVKYKEWGIF
ncbi:Uncharacterised protein [Campylobacter hyointestinalis subsp. hyointestinalis]|uniref:Uncharacterized protein n=1 Tax=Campylobacter hyointestinalis subsp. hyointestinalis TaxID=91352 RepID=A0A9W5APK0_CAMHY|nr:hypothetical protein [Campylobacter hyointestinalis]CUU75089.1 Uncharacterised protein [Campylobacter hyointestinalis subsp. hyointestinalis]CUU77679.1 Uncharacterised protein [Campylobacter hyointestinalis subsp. hyointestinalis]CUU77776.1 Uncharacterised protein [Campylobacter hyointestinalis subsp. hyointestinalis]